MPTLIAKVKNGRIDVPALPEFPDGTEVEVSLRLAPDTPLPIDNDPYSIDNWLAGAGSDEPPLITDAESEFMRTMRKAERDLEKARAKLRDTRAGNEP